MGNYMRQEEPPSFIQQEDLAGQVLEVMVELEIAHHIRGTQQVVLMEQVQEAEEVRITQPHFYQQAQAAQASSSSATVKQQILLQIQYFLY